MIFDIWPFFAILNAFPISEFKTNAVWQFLVQNEYITKN